MLSFNPYHWPIYICSFMMVANMMYSWYKQWRMTRRQEKIKSCITAITATGISVYFAGEWKRLNDQVRDITGELLEMKINQPTWEAINDIMERKFSGNQMKTPAVKPYVNCNYSPVPPPTPEVLAMAQSVEEYFNTPLEDLREVSDEEDENPEQNVEKVDQTEQRRFGFFSQ